MRVARPIVLDVQYAATILGGEGDCNRSSFRVLHRVVHGLLGDAVQLDCRPTLAGVRGPATAELAIET